jgi:hypothetical protein
MRTFDVMEDGEERSKATYSDGTPWVGDYCSSEDALKLEECLLQVLNFMENPAIGTWPYMEGTGFYDDLAKQKKAIRNVLTDVRKIVFKG